MNSIIKYINTIVGKGNPLKITLTGDYSKKQK